MAIQISGTTVIDNSRNLSNIANATTAATANTYAIRDANGNLSAANLTANMSVYTGPGTFVVPPSTTRLKVTVTGGGGDYTTPTLNRGGGAGGGTGIAVINVTPGSSIPLTVGAAGAPGGSSTFGSFVTATGGGEEDAGGTASFPSPAPSYVAKLTIGGQAGTIRTRSDIARAGGVSFWGGNSTPGGAYGSGSAIVAGRDPGWVVAGKSGVVVVEW